MKDSEMNFVPTDEFAGAYQKLNRAMFHIDDLRKIINNLGRTHPISLTAADKIDGWIPILAHFNAPETGPMSTVAADAIQNLRSSLDLAVCALVRKNGIFDKRQIREASFPFGRDEADWKKKCSSLAALTGIAGVARIDACGAYTQGPGKKLKVLQKLSNIDKHELLAPTTPITPTDITLRLYIDEKNRTSSRAEIRVGPLMSGKRPAESGDEVLSISSKNATRAELETSIGMSIAFDDSDIPEHEDAPQTLSLIHSAVEEALTSMRGT